MHIPGSPKLEGGYAGELANESLTKESLRILLSWDSFVSTLVCQNNPPLKKRLKKDLKVSIYTYFLNVFVFFV